MRIRRKSTAHDLATLRLHPDGSRVQQSSLNAGRRTASSTVIDPRGNWIAKDAGGKCFVSTRRNAGGARANDTEHELVDLSGDEHASSKNKGKRRARDGQTPDEDALQLNTRTRQRLSFMCDHSFLDPPPASLSSLEQDMDPSDATSTPGPAIIFPDPAPDLLKSIHHFTSCYYRERDQLFDSGRDYRGKRRERRERSEENIHVITANPPEYQNLNSETERTETEDECSEGEGEEIDGDSEKEGPKSQPDIHRKDMYKAFDGSALVAIGIVLQEYVAHTLSPGPHTSEEYWHPKRRRTEKDGSG